ncbi:MAG: DUF3152 domain-containing protein, partial [Mycobacteriales bacterium]
AAQAAASPRRGRGGPPPGNRFTPPYRLVELRVPDGPLSARVDPLRRPPGGRRPMTFAARSSRPQGSRLRRFVRAYGWRAYAIPLLTVLTVLCGVGAARGSSAGLPLRLGGGSGSRDAAETLPTPARPSGSTVAQPDPRPTSTRIYVDDGNPGARSLPSTELPAGGPYSKTGGGRFDTVPGTSKVYGTGPLRRFTVEVEAGVAEDGPTFAAAVEQILGSPRSWGAGGRMSFQRVDGGDGGAVDFRVSLTASMTVRNLCGYTLPFETSCYNGELSRAVINDARWVRGAVAYAGNLTAYRTYVINHEVGHALGHDHQQCPKAGAPAPVMMQQTLGVGGCRPNAFPYP